MPTSKPTEKPTEKPTYKPVPHPTQKPTEKPTDKPTDKPTEKPTDKPVYKPTPKRTEKPTEKPVAHQTPKPTDEPTDKPTDEPFYSKGKGYDEYSKGKGNGKGYDDSSSKGKGKGYDNYSKGKGKGKGFGADSKGKGKGKGYDDYKSTPNPTDKPTDEPTIFCRDTVFYTYQLWDGPAVEANGTKVDIWHASADMGLQWPFVGTVRDAYNDEDVGFNVENHERVDNGNFWHSEGTYINLYGCSGYLAFSGFSQDATNSGHYVITGGTGAFLGAQGYIYEQFDVQTGTSYREINIH
ncbi:hypothetical protein ACA910_021298 [Epithemia clementina (nom. ined.)]